MASGSGSVHIVQPTHRLVPVVWCTSRHRQRHAIAAHLSRLHDMTVRRPIYIRTSTHNCSRARLAGAVARSAQRAGGPRAEPTFLSPDAKLNLAASCGRQDGAALPRGVVVAIRIPTASDPLGCTPVRHARTDQGVTAKLGSP